MDSREYSRVLEYFIVFELSIGAEEGLSYRRGRQDRRREIGRVLRKPEHYHTDVGLPPSGGGQLGPRGVFWHARALRRARS